MKKSAQKSKSSTQNFTEIQDIIENIVLLSSGNACLIIEIQATNFALLSPEEQNVKLLAYSSLLNSLMFPVQIVIRSKKIDISSYLKLLDEEVRTGQNQLLKNQIVLYKEFVQEMVKVNVVLDKKFYMVVSYSYMEGNIVGGKDNFFARAKATLSSRAEALHVQLARLNLLAKTLDKENLVKLFYEVFNGDSEHIGQAGENVKFPIVKRSVF